MFLRLTIVSFSDMYKYRIIVVHLKLVLYVNYASIIKQWVPLLPGAAFRVG